MTWKSSIRDRQDFTVHLLFNGMINISSLTSFSLFLNAMVIIFIRERESIITLSSMVLSCTCLKDDLTILSEGNKITWKSSIKDRQDFTVHLLSTDMTSLTPLSLSLPSPHICIHEGVRQLPAMTIHGNVSPVCNDPPLFTTSSSYVFSYFVLACSFASCMIY